MPKKGKSKIANEAIDYKWAHLDIAATGSDGDEVTGRSVKMLIEYIKQRAK